MSEKDLFKVQKPKIHRTLAGMGGGSFEFDPKCDSPFLRLQTFDQKINIWGGLNIVMPGKFSCDVLCLKSLEIQTRGEYF